MKILRTIDELKNFRRKLEGKRIGFVPTMGALHDGHLELIKHARYDNDIVFASIFVNPTQFLEGEDFESYPRKMDEDIRKCRLTGVDYLFLPLVSELYFPDEVQVKAPDIKSYILEGFRRPEHFDGVLRVVLKFFNLIRPTHAYFGKKDAQQLYMIEQMVRDLFLDIKIVPVDIVRNKSGLALSSRNAYLSDEEIVLANKVSASLKKALNMIINRELHSQSIKKELNFLLSSLEIEYVEIVNRKFESIETIEPENTIILIAVKVGTTRLIDNLWI